MMGKPFVMRMADRIDKGAKHYYEPWSAISREDVLRDAKLVRQNVAGIPRFILDGLMPIKKQIELRIPQEKGNWAKQLSVAFPIPKPPFPKLWAEYVLDEPLGHLSTVGVLAVTYPKGEFNALKEEFNADWYITLFMTGMGHVDGAWIWKCLFFLGYYLDSAGSWVHGIRAFGSNMEEGDTTAIYDCLNIAAPVLYGFSLSNTKNTRQEIVESAPEHIRKSIQKKTGRPLLTYRTLSIPADSSGTRYLRCDKLTDELRAHLRRGSFATYTEEKKLFGKYTGTFWRPATVCGSRKVGVAAKDYNVKERRPVCA